MQSQGFLSYRRERLSKGGRGLMALVNQDLTTKRRSDLENDEIEAIWLEIFPLKS